MTPLLTAAEARAADAHLIEGLGLPSRQLMELAGKGAAEALQARFPTGPVVVLCGPGNNGGDGYVLARWLALWGRPVVAVPVLPPRTPDAQVNADLAAQMGITGERPALGPQHRPQVLVDALLGTGQRSAPRGPLAEAVGYLQQARHDGHPVVALDLPTGLCADTGASLVHTVTADLTVSFGAHKRGLYTGTGAAFAGERVLVDIGFGHALQRLPPGAQLTEAAEVDRWAPAPAPGAAKWDRGHVAVRAGGGAAVLCAQAALQAGAGLVTLLVPREDQPTLPPRWPELILAEPAALDSRRHNVLVIGPGLGLQAGAEVLHAWSTFPGPVVVDADALRLLPTDLPPPAGLRVLTPHSAEAAHLLGWARDAVEADRFTAQQALSRWGLSVLKGPHTLVGVDPIRVNPTGDARLATAGTGDVLAGWIGAQLLPAALAAAGGPAEAVAVAVYRHGAAAAGMHSNRAGTLLDPR